LARLKDSQEMFDTSMPGTNGLTLAVMARGKTELSASDILLLTAAERPRDLVRSRELPIDAHMLKPVSQYAEHRPDDVRCGPL
jgi:two-component system, sensor histidine kinase and response regulator